MWQEIEGEVVIKGILERFELFFVVLCLGQDLRYPRLASKSLCSH